MGYLTGLSLFFLLVSTSVYAEASSCGTSEVWLCWLGNYHFIFVHFPVALISMACVAELLFSWKKDPYYDFVVSFLLVSAMILTIPTVVSGLSLEESAAGGEQFSSLIEWHEGFGIATLCLSATTVLIRFFLNWRSLYLCSLLALVICVIITAHFGGVMAFEEFTLLPPLFTS